MSERILLSETLALSGNSSARSLQRIAWPPFMTRLSTVLLILSSPAGPVRDRMICGSKTPVGSVLEQHEPALGPREDLEQRVEDPFEHLAQDERAAQLLADQPQGAKLGLGLDHREVLVALVQDVDRREDRRLLVALLDLHQAAVEVEQQLADLKRVSILEKHRLSELSARRRTFRACCPGP